MLGALDIDAGTLCLAPTPVPGPVVHGHKVVERHHHHKAKTAHKSGHHAGHHVAHKPKARHLSPAGHKAVQRPHTPRGAELLSDADCQAAAEALGTGISAALVRAFAEVESGGKSGFGADGRPVIAYEGHVFRKLTHRAYDADHPFLSYKYVKKAGPEWQHNNATQTKAWETLTEALALDHDAALQACSWGMFQVMGFNYKDCGYDTPDAFVAAMKGGEKGQLLAFVGFCKKKAGMVAAMQAKDFVGMASRYNGDDYGDYDQRIAKAYKRHGGT